MSSSPEQRLAELGIALPRPAAPVANYVGAARTGNLVFVSGQLCFGPDGKLLHKGKVGVEVSVDDAKAAARACGINILAQVRALLGSLDQVSRVVRLGGFIAAPASFIEHPPIMNGASDLMVEVFGDKGRHARTTLGMASLPMDSPVEVEAIFEVA